MSATDPAALALLFSVVVPTRGESARLLALADALARQGLARERWEIVVVPDGVALAPDVLGRLERLGARVSATAARRGPGAARNHGAALARGAWLAFTEDDVTPAPDWLERAAARLEAEPALDVLEGRTVKPGGRPVHRQSQDAPLYLPTNLFVRREAFARAGGYCEDFFDAALGVYFREDADLGWTLEEAGARVGREPGVLVTHPEEHQGFSSPLAWARRHEMDPLLAARHPERFRQRLEVHRLGPLIVRRPVVRASVGCVVAAALALLAFALRSPDLAAGFAALAVLAFAVVWAKWRFAPLRLPVVLLVPFVLTAALLRGHRRVARLKSAGAGSA